MNLEEHPTVRWFRAQESAPGGDGPGGSTATPPAPPSLEAAVLRDLCLQTGANDAGFVEIDRPALATQRGGVLEAFPATRTLIGLAYSLNRENLRSTRHSNASLEFKQAWDHANRTGRVLARSLNDAGIPALNAPAGFPFDTEGWPGVIWFTADKIVAEEAGLGRMGRHHCVIHPRLGGAVVLGTVLIGADLDTYDTPLDFNPCLECGLCNGVCPTGAISADGAFDFLSCYTHNYRERLGGFQSWVENVAASGSVKDYRARVSDPETVSMWQNLSIGAQTKCDKCMAVCPAGEAAIGDYLPDRKGYTERVAHRLRDTDETVFVTPGSDAEAYVAKRFPAKRVRRVASGIRPQTAAGFIGSLPLVFQKGQAAGLAATYHFTFTGAENLEATVTIRDGRLDSQPGHTGAADLHITADAETWVSFLAKETSLPRALATRKLKIKGSPKLMTAFARCFPL
ncbi:MAG: SCP2 sterol-binding domain-containing protein [Thermoleophilia bacterium]